MYGISHFFPKEKIVHASPACDWILFFSFRMHMLHVLVISVTSVCEYFDQRLKNDLYFCRKIHLKEDFTQKVWWIIVSLA